MKIVILAANGDEWPIVMTLYFANARACVQSLYICEVRILCNCHRRAGELEVLYRKEFWSQNYANKCKRINNYDYDYRSVVAERKDERYSGWFNFGSQ